MAGIGNVTEPPLVEVSPGHLMGCHIPIEELAGQAKAKPGDVLYSAMPVVMTDAEELDAGAASTAETGDCVRRLRGATATSPEAA